MVNVRRGINIRVGFSVYRNGIPEDLSQAQNLRVVIRHKCQPNSAAAFTGSAINIEGNSVSVVVTDTMQKTMASGEYLIEVAYRLINPLAQDGYDPYIIDSAVFTLTDRSSDVGGVSCGDVTVQVVNISGEVSFCSQALDEILVEASGAVQAANAATQAANDAADAAMAIVDSKVNIDGLNANVKRLQFDTNSPTAPMQIGQIAWDNDEHTLVTHDGLHTHPLGKELELRARNTSGVTILNGRACYVTGSTGDNPTIALATNTDGDVAQKIIGVAAMDIANNAFGIVTTFGEVNDIDTSGLTLGAIVYLGANGLLTTTEPVAPTPKIVIGLCVRQHAQVGKLFVSTRPIARLNKLSEVHAPTLTDNDVLRYNGTTLRWEVYSLAGKADLVGGKVPSAQLPAYVDDVLEYANLAAFPATGETGKIYVALNTNLTYRWSGTAYVEISKSLALGETSDTAYRGDRGKTAYDHSQATGNPHSTTAAQIPNTPAGTVAATTVQGAINELAGDIVQVETNLNTTKDNISIKTNVSLLSPTYINYYFDRSKSTKALAQTASTSFSSHSVYVSPGDKYLGTARLGGGSMAMAVFYDISGNKISHILSGDSSLHSDVDLIAPVDAYEMIFCWGKSTTPKLVRITYGINNKVSDLEQNVLTIGALSNSAINLSEETKSDLDFLSEHKNLYDYDSVGTVIGVITTPGSLYTSGFSTGLIPVKPNHFYYLSNRVNGAINSIRCLAQDGVTRSKVRVASTGLEAASGIYYYLPKEDGSIQVTNGQFKTSPTASYIQISLTTLNATVLGDNYKIMLEDVGEMYDPTFQPSEYKPYELKIKDESLEFRVAPVIQRVESLENKINKIKVLLIGSSHGMNTIGQFPILAHNSGVDIICANAYQGSLSLQQIAEYCNNGTNFAGWYKKFYDGTWHGSQTVTISQMLQDEDWDFISIQRSASEDTTWTLEQAGYFEIILAYITSNCDYTPTIVFNSGFADSYSIATRSTQQADTETIWATAQNVKNNYGISIIPMATVLQAVRNNDILAGLGSYVYKMLSCDSQHLDQGIGMYVSGCICFNFFLKHLGRNILTCNYLPTVSDITPFWYDVAKYTPIEEQYAKEIRKIVNTYFANN